MNKQAMFEGRKQILLFLCGPRIVFLAILKNTLELENWTNRNQEFTQWTNSQQRGPHRNSVDILVSPVNVISLICCLPPKPRWKWKWRHLIRAAYWKFKNQQSYLFTSKTVNFCPNLWIVSRDSVLFRHPNWQQTSPADFLVAALLPTLI